MVTIYLFLLFVIFIIFHAVTRYSRRGRLLQKIPGPAPYPIFGNIFMLTLKNATDFWATGRAVTKDYYPLTRIWTCTDAVVFIRHPDDLEIILSSQKVIEKGYIYEYLHPWLKTGLLTSTGEKWRQRRKMLTPAFHFSILKKYMDIANEEGEKFIKSLKAEGDGVVQSLTPLCSNYTLNVICESAMGISLHFMNNKTVNEYKQAVYDMGKIVFFRTSKPYILSWMMPFIYKINGIQRNALKTLYEFTNKILEDRKEYHKQTNYRFLKNCVDDQETSTFDDIEAGRKKRLAMLDLLLEAQHNRLIDDEGIMEEVDTFTFEGHDTTGMTLVYVLLSLAENKEIQDQARAEVTELFDRIDGKLEIAHFQELNYLDRCIKETLRLYPPVATLMRFTREDLQLKHAFIPANTNLMLHLYDTHRDPNFWPDPEKFDPDRFLPENTKYRHPFSYVPFSAGPRNCIGQKFAMMEMKSILSKILYNFYLEPVSRSSDIKIVADIILRPEDPLKIKFIKINKNTNS